MGLKNAVQYGEKNSPKIKVRILQKILDKKGMKQLILITKEECEILREKLGAGMPHVAITNRHKKGARKKRYIEENRKVMKLLKEIRDS